MSSNNKLVALVTGGNKGIGFETCRHLIKSGKFKVILTARQNKLGEEAVKSLKEEFKVGDESISFAPLDVTKEDSVKSLVQHLLNNKSQFLPLDVLINNAGAASKGSTVNEQIASQTIGVNYFGVKRVTEHLLPHINKESGRIVIVSSRIGQLGSEDQYKDSKFYQFAGDNVFGLTIDDVSKSMNEFVEAVKDGNYEEKGWGKNTYKVSKVGVNAYARLLAKQFQNSSEYKKITVNNCCPGWCKTDMGGPNATRTTEEGAEVVYFLASDDSVKNETGGFYGEQKKISW